MTTNTTSTTSSVTNASVDLWFARFLGTSRVNINNATGKGNRAARRAGWYVKPTAGPDWTAERRQLLASI